MNDSHSLRGTEGSMGGRGNETNVNHEIGRGHEGVGRRMSGGYKLGGTGGSMRGERHRGRGGEEPPSYDESQRWRRGDNPPSYDESQRYHNSQ